MSMIREKRMIAFVLVLVVATMNIFTIQAQAKSNICVTYTGDNIEHQNYAVYASPMYSFLHNCGDGTLMRVQYLGGKSQFVVEYYDMEYNLLSSRDISMKWNLFGGFYALGNFYYILSGQQNKEESDEKEVYCITKYDKEWNEISFCSLNGANTYIPFASGSARMTSIGKYLLIRTCHEMYQLDDGKHHQANVTIEVDTESMEITDSYYDVMNYNYGYISHSFNQFIQVEDNKIVAVDHGDAYPRCVALTKYPTDCSEGKFQSGKCEIYSLLAFKGNIGDNYTGASIGGFEISDSAYLVAGNYDIDLSSGYKQGRNIFIAKKDKETSLVSVNYITDYEAGDGQTTTPQFVSIGENKYLLLWYKDSKVFYTQIDGDGNREGEIYSMEGDLSDCVPVMAGNKLVWYVWDNENITFYEINTLNLSDTSMKTEKLGHDYIYDPCVKNGMVTRICIKCGTKSEVSVPTSFYTVWKSLNSDKYISSPSYTSYEVGDTILCQAVPKNGELSEMEAISQDEDMISILQSGNNIFMKLNKVGMTTVTVRPRYNPDVAETYIFRIGEDASLDINEAVVTVKDIAYGDTVLKQEYTGEEIRPEVTVSYKGIALSEHVDYEVSYENNINAGTAYIKVSGDGLFKGTNTLSFSITPIELKYFCDVSLNKTWYEYNGFAKSPSVVVKHDTQVVSPEEYTVTYKDNMEAGIAKAIVVGNGNYMGTEVKEYVINPLHLSKCNISLEYKYAEYTGEALMPSVVVKMGGNVISEENYKVSYLDNTDAGTAKVIIEGMKSCEGVVELSFRIYMMPAEPTAEPTTVPTTQPTNTPIETLATVPTTQPTNTPTEIPATVSTTQPMNTPTEKPTTVPTTQPMNTPIEKPTMTPAIQSTNIPGEKPTPVPTVKPTNTPISVITAKPAAKGTVLTVAKQKCRVKVLSSSGKNPTVSYWQTTNAKASNITIPSTVRVNGITYKVTAIGNGAFRGNKKLTKITIGNNINTIGKNAFKDCKALKSMVVKTSNLKVVGKNAIKGTNKKLVIKVPRKKVSAYKKHFKGKGNTKITIK